MQTPMKIPYSHARPTTWTHANTIVLRMRSKPVYAQIPAIPEPAEEIILRTSPIVNVQTMNVKTIMKTSENYANVRQQTPWASAPSMQMKPVPPAIVIM